MMLNIKEWSIEEAEKNFRRIEKCKTEEWYGIDWKRELCFEDTSRKKNTTQRAVSGFANAFGGSLVIGFDDKGRKQYIYNPDWIAHQQQNKFEGMIRFGEILPKLRRTVYRHMTQEELTRKRILAFLKSLP